MLPGHRCAECGKLSVDEGLSCPDCGSQERTPVELSGRGRLVSWTVIRVPPDRYAADAPYTVGLLELEEGPRLTTRLAADPDQLTAGQSVTFVSLDPSCGPIFRPA